MKVLLIGSGRDERFVQLSGHVGASLAEARHEILACSPFPDALDGHAVKAALKARPDASVHVHFPGTPEIEKRWEDLGVPAEKRHPHEASPDRSIAWLTSQIHAQADAEAVVMLGGVNSGPARLLTSMLLERRLPLLPFSVAGGLAAATRFDHLLLLRERLGLLDDALDRKEGPARTATLLSALVDPARTEGQPLRPSGHRYFISYSRARSAEADTVETLLRRAGRFVFRDEHAFGVGEDVPREIRRALAASTVFIAMWCAEYACSPHCFDELSDALDAHEKRPLQLWLIRLDETRMVHPKARSLLYHDARTRTDLERLVATLLGRHG